MTPTDELDELMTRSRAVADPVAGFLDRLSATVTAVGPTPSARLAAFLDQPSVDVAAQPEPTSLRRTRRERVRSGRTWRAPALRVLAMGWVAKTVIGTAAVALASTAAVAGLKIEHQPPAPSHRQTGQVPRHVAPPASRAQSPAVDPSNAPTGSTPFRHASTPTSTAGGSRKSDDASSSGKHSSGSGQGSASGSGKGGTGDNSGSDGNSTHSGNGESGGEDSHGGNSQSGSGKSDSGSSGSGSGKNDSGGGSDDSTSGGSHGGDGDSGPDDGGSN
jgi:hypothetical protein